MYFKVKDIVFIAIIAVVMMVVSFLTLPLVTAFFAVIPGIGVLVVAPFYGLLIALLLSKVQKVGATTFASLILGLPLIFISPSITMFTIGSGLFADLIAFLWKGVFKSQRKIIILSSIYILAMFYLGLLAGSIFVVTGFSPEHLAQNIPLVIAGSLLALGMAAAGGFVGTKLSREFQQAGVIR
jgi:hypothetical protein